jgi:hypothetical protein
VAAKARKLKTITLTIGGTSVEAQVTTWNITNNTDDPEIIYTFSPDGAVTDTPDPSWSLDLSFLQDWSVGGISDYLTVHGNVTLKAPGAGGDARTNEVGEVKLTIVGEPVYTHL